MNTLKRHKFFHSAFLAVFVIYAISPLFTHVSEDGFVEEKGTSRQFKKIFFVDLLIKSILADDCGDFSQEENDYVIVKRKRVVLKRLDDIKPLAPETVAVETPEYKVVRPYSAFARVDQKTGSKTFCGFLPLYSGLSPPVV